MKTLIVVAVFILALIASWAVTSGIIYAICALLGCDFSIAVSTAIWLAMFLIKSTVSRSGKN